MTAYVIVLRETPVHDAEAMAQYQSKSRESKGDFKLLPRVVYGAVEALEGTAPDGVVMLEFPPWKRQKPGTTIPTTRRFFPFD